jgi:drug/metabolite transporter (DMT)-like permease
MASAFVLFTVMTLPAPLALLRLRREPVRDRGATWGLVMLGVFDAINTWLWFEAVQRGPVAVAVLTHYLAPLLVAACAPWVTGERRSRRTLVATPLSLLGLLMLIGVPGGAGFNLVTASLGAASAVFYAGMVFAAKRAARGYSPLAVTSLHAPISGVLLAAVFGARVLPAPGSQWGWVVLGALICGLLGQSLFNAGLRRIPTSSASTLTYLEPVVATCVGWAAFGERLTAWGVLGAALVLGCGAWVVSEPEPVPAPAALPPP